MNAGDLGSPRAARFAVTFLALAISGPLPLSAQQSALSSSAPDIPPGITGSAAAPLVFEGVTIVDVTDGRLVPGQTVVVVGNRIQTVGQTKTRPGAQVVNAEGKYMIPGLWDMHTHVDAKVNEAYPRFLAHGVTGMREMGQRFPHGTDSFRIWQREVAAGTRVGPRSIGPSVDLTLPKRGEKYQVGTPEQIRHVMDSLKKAGIVFFKYHGGPANHEALEQFFAMLRESRRLGTPLVGHTPSWRLKLTEAQIADSGYINIEHFNSLNPCFPAMMMKEDSAAIVEKCSAAAKGYVRNGTWFGPTIGFAYRKNKYAWDKVMYTVRLMRQFGVKNFLAGSDLVCCGRPSSLVQPGFALLLEAVFLTMADFTPLEALQAATLNPVKFLGATDSLGTVATGKIADLVLLDANPLADIRNLMKAWGVVANGRYFENKSLDALDPARHTLVEAFETEWPKETQGGLSTP